MEIQIYQDIKESESYSNIYSTCFIEIYNIIIIVSQSYSSCHIKYNLHWPCAALRWLPPDRCIAVCLSQTAKKMGQGTHS